MAVSGRADLALVYNPEPLPALAIQPLQDEKLSLISPVDAAPPGPVPLKDLPLYPLVLPQRGCNFRKLMETAAAFAQVPLNVAWEVSSLPVILDLVSAGLGHAALGESALSAFAHPERLAITPFQDADIKSTLCLITQKRSTPLQERTAALLKELVQTPATAAA
ncbi:LysR substrate-binding domain-containing protein [Roseateles sp. GG27B]